MRVPAGWTLVFPEDEISAFGTIINHPFICLAKNSNGELAVLTQRHGDARTAWIETPLTAPGQCGCAITSPNGRWVLTAEQPRQAGCAVRLYDTEERQEFAGSLLVEAPPVGSNRIPTGIVSNAGVATLRVGGALRQ